MKIVSNRKTTKILFVLFLLITLVFLPESFHAQIQNNGYPSSFDRDYVTQSSPSLFDNPENEFGNRLIGERARLTATASVGGTCMECGGEIGPDGHCMSCGWPFDNDSITGELPIGNELWVLSIFGVIYLLKQKFNREQISDSCRGFLPNA